jgi:phosphoglycolate phosphatase-like HAD superfamily hydrolase
LRRDPNAPTEKRGLAIAPEMKDLFRQLRDAGIAAYVVSGSYKEILLVSADPDFGLTIAPENIFGAELAKGADGRFTGDFAEGCVKSGRKPDFIRAHIAPRHHGAEPVLAAGDSMGDYTMLTEFKGLQTALLFQRDWPNKEMWALSASGDPVAVQGRDEIRGCFVPSHTSISP